MDTITKEYTGKTIAYPEGQIEAVFNTGLIDRYTEVCPPSAFKKRIGTFKANPQLLWSHSNMELPLGSVTEIALGKEDIRGRVQLALENPKAETIYRMIKSGHGPNSFSIAFIPHAWEDDYKLPKGHPQAGQVAKRYYTDAEITEISLVNIPASPGSSLVSVKDATRKGMELRILPEYKIRELENALDEPLNEIADDEIAEFWSDLGVDDVDLEIEDLDPVLRPYPNEHACRIMDPGQFTRFRRVNCGRKHDGRCIDVIYGRRRDTGKVAVQALRYKLDDGWTAEAAGKHCAGVGGKFEAAVGKDLSASEAKMIIEDWMEDKVKAEIRRRQGKIDLPKKEV